MSKSNALEQQILDYIFLGTAPPWAGDATMYVAYHTADPGEAGDQTTNEASYAGYARVAVSRSGSGFSRTGSVMSNVPAFEFPECSEVITQVLTHFSYGRNASGAGQIFYKGALTDSVTVTQNATPRSLAGTITVTED